MVQVRLTGSLGACGFTLEEIAGVVENLFAQLGGKLIDQRVERLTVHNDMINDAYSELTHLR